MTNLILDKKGNISTLRIALLFVFIGLIGIGIGFAVWQLEHNSRRSPFDVALFPNVEEIRRDDGASTRRVIYYRTEATPNEVRDFYQAALDDHLGQNPNDPLRANTHTLCVRNPATGSFPDHTPGSGTMPFYFRCNFDNSFFGSQQSTVITIEPGVLMPDGEDNTGATFIIYEQRWSR